MKRRKISRFQIVNNYMIMMIIIDNNNNDYIFMYLVYILLREANQDKEGIWELSEV